MNKKTAQFALEAGLNQTTSQLKLPPGALINVLNYENAVGGGYQRISGYERYDGRVATPSLANYTRIDFNQGGPRQIAVGDFVTGGTSGATGYVLAVAPLTSGSWGSNIAVGNFGINRVTGTFVIGEAISIASVLACRTVYIATGGAIDDAYRKTYLRATQAYTRGLIGAVPGEGPIRGVWVYAEKVYAFRNAVGSATCSMFVSSTTGWTVVKTLLAPNGAYEFVNYNFGGAAGTVKMYGVSGVHKGFEFDGTTWTDITVTGMAVDAPTHLAAHKNRLFFSFRRGSVQFSSPGAPNTWSAILGAGEFGIGDEVTNIYSIRQDSLGVWGRNSVSILQGDGPATYQMKKNSFQTGAMTGGVQEIDGQILFVDPRGMFNLQAVVQYGDYKPESLADPVQALFVLEAKTLKCSVLSRKKKHIRIFFSDKTSLSVSISGASASLGPQSQYQENSLAPVWMRAQYADQFTCTCMNEIAEEEVVFAGSDNGFVYQLDKGTSFDGAAIQSLLNTPFYHYGSSLIKKWFRRIELEMSAALPFVLQLKADFNYGSSSTTQVDALSIPNTGGYWDQSLWENFYWDAPYTGTPVVNLKGTGRNMALSLAHTDDIDAPFIVQSVNINFDIMSAQR